MTSKDNHDNLFAALDRVMRQLRRRSGTQPHHGRAAFRILRILEKSPGITTSELAKTLDVRPASLNEKLAALEQEGLIRRMRNREDRRSFQVELLPGGKDLLESVRAERGVFLATAAAILSEEERSQLTCLAEKLAAGLEQLSGSVQQNGGEDSCK